MVREAHPTWLAQPSIAPGSPGALLPEKLPTLFLTLTE